MRVSKRSASGPKRQWFAESRLGVVRLQRGTNMIELQPVHLEVHARFADIRAVTLSPVRSRKPTAR
jgi:hypothetical protein